MAWIGNKDIVKINQGVSRLKDVFEDLAFIVDAQGEVVDNIEKNMDMVKADVDKAEENLKKSKQNISQGNKIMMYVCGGVLLAGMIAVILYFVFRKN